MPCKSTTSQPHFSISYETNRKTASGAPTPWHDSLLRLLRKGQRAGEAAEAGSDSSSHIIIVDNAKPHRRLSECPTTSSTVTPTSSLDENYDDFKLFLDSLFEERDDHDRSSTDVGSSSSSLIEHMHNSYPARRRSRRVRTRAHSMNHGQRHHQHRHQQVPLNDFRWGSSSSDSHISLSSSSDHLTLDDMLHEEFSVSRSAVPRRPVRQVSMEGLPWEGDVTPNDSSDHSLEHSAESGPVKLKA